MRTLRTVAEVRTALRPARRAGRTIALVPTMGALHDGHLALIRQARAGYDEVVVSLFVNPTQFGDAADLAAYPRDEERDAGLAAEAGADLLFAPSAEELYPAGFATQVTLVRPAGQHPGGRPPGRRALPRGGDRRHQAAQHRPARRRASSAARTPSRRSSSSAWSPTWTSRCASSSGRPSASPTAWPARAATSA